MRPHLDTGNAADQKIGDPYCDLIGKPVYAFDPSIGITLGHYAGMREYAGEAVRVIEQPAREPIFIANDAALGLLHAERDHAGIENPFDWLAISIFARIAMQLDQASNTESAEEAHGYITPEQALCHLCTAASYNSARLPAGSLWHLIGRESIILYDNRFNLPPAELRQRLEAVHEIAVLQDELCRYVDALMQDDKRTNGRRPLSELYRVHIREKVQRAILDHIAQLATNRSVDAPAED